jgi:hypothetical protein
MTMRDPDQIDEDLDAHEDRLAELEDEPAVKTVDAGWRSRKFLACLLLGVLMIGLSSVLLVISGTGVLIPLIDGAPKPGWFPVLYWAIGCGAGLVTALVGMGLVQLDKLIDLVREALPILRARWGAPPKVGS